MRLLCRLVLVAVAVIAVGLTLTRPAREVRADAELQYLPNDWASSLVVAADAVQCSLLDTSTGVTGQDGGYSYVYGGKTYWIWSDTFASTAPGYVANSASTSAPGIAPAQAEGAPADTPCFPMQYSTTEGSINELLPEPSTGCVDWPTQPVSLDALPADGTVTSAVTTPEPGPGATTGSVPPLGFIYVRQAPSGAGTPCASPIGAGIGAFDPSTMRAIRLDDTLTWPDMAGDAVQVTGGMPLRANDGDGDFIYLVLVAGADPDPLGSTTEMVLARVAPNDFASPGLYRYWTGTGWVAWDAFRALDPQDNAHFLWRQPDWGIQAGVKVSYVQHLHKWAAVYASNLAGEVRMRTADHLTGPWSGERRMIDCRAQRSVLPPHLGGPTAVDWPCYSGMIHDELTSADGLTMYVSFARNNWPAGGDYRTYLRRFNLASPVNEWMGTDGARTLVVGDQSGVGVRQGLAFFASEVPLAGYAAVYAFDAQPPLAADRMYGLDVLPPPGYAPAGVAFYVPRYARPSIDESLASVHAVRLPSGQHAYTTGAIPSGATDEGVVFSALVLNPDVDKDGVPDVSDNCPFTINPTQVDTDHDRAGDECDKDADNDNVPDFKLVAGPFPFGFKDNCRTVPNADQSDIDGDRLGDACEASVYGTDPLRADSDADGCGDGAEVLRGLNPTNSWDFYNVPYRALVTDAAGTIDTGVGMTTDLAALMMYMGRRPGDVIYDQDLDRNGVPDGRQYDRSNRVVSGKHLPGPPDGGIGMTSDVVTLIAQSGTTC